MKVWPDAPASTAVAVLVICCELKVLYRRRFPESAVSLAVSLVCFLF